MSTVTLIASVFSDMTTVFNSAWSDKKTLEGWTDSDVTFPNFSDAALDPNASDECKIKYYGYGIRLIARWIQCFADHDDEEEVQDCVDDNWENFFLPNVAGCIVEE